MHDGYSQDPTPDNDTKAAPLPQVTADAVALNLVADELRRARALHEPIHSPHEAHSVIWEELDEFWDEVKLKRSERTPANMRKELIQTAAVSLRAAVDLGLIDWNLIANAPASSPGQ